MSLQGTTYVLGGFVVYLIFLQNKMQHLHATIIYIKNENQHFSVSPPPTPRQCEMQVEDGKDIHIAEGAILSSYAPPPPFSFAPSTKLVKEPYEQDLLAIRLFDLL